MNSKRKEKLGDWSLDIAKYIFTAVIIARWFSNEGEWHWYNYILPIIVVLIAICFGLMWIGTDDKDSNEETNKK